MNEQYFFFSITKWEFFITLVQLYTNFFLSTFIIEINRKWCWTSPDGATKNEIDLIISNTKNIVKVSVLNKFIVGSDHHMIRAKVVFNIKKESPKLIAKKKSTKRILIDRPQQCETIFSGNLLKNLMYLNLEEINENSIKLRETYEKMPTTTEHDTRLSKNTLTLLIN